MTTRERIVEKSTDMFVKYGVKSIRMDDIASQMGVSKRTIYELFGDRETLITDCVACFHKRQDLCNKEKIKPAGNVIEEFFLLVDGWEGSMNESIAFMSDLQRFYPSIFEQIMTKRHKDGIENLKERLKNGVEQGLFITDIDFGFAATVLTEALYSIFKRPSSYGESNISQSEAFTYIMLFFFRGLSTQKGIKILDKLIKNRL